MTDFGGKTCIFSHPVYLFLREFSLQDSRGGSVDDVLHIDGTAAANPHSQLIIVSTATKRQRFQMKTFFLDQIL
ncbi:hypothetical protein EQ830_26885, partial [Escherichia coli]